MNANPSSPDNKRNRVIHWNPEAETGRASRSLSPALKWGLGGTLAVVALLGLSLATGTIWKKPAPEAAGGQPMLSGVLEAIPETGPINPRDAFVSQTRADMARETASAALDGVRRTPADHPILLTRLIELERSFTNAERARNSGRFAEALAGYERIQQGVRSFSESVTHMREARQKYNAFLADLEKLSRWRSVNPMAFDRALAEASEARFFLEEGEFTTARNKMQSARAQLDQLESTLEENLSQSLQTGRVALARGDAVQASEAFSRVLEIDADNEVAQAGLRRAATVEEVVSFLQRGERLEESGDLEGALRAYTDAFALDSASTLAQQGEARVRLKIQERDFAAALDRAAIAERRNQWDEAIAAYEEARAIFPKREEVAGKLAKARQIKRERFIEDSLSRAFLFEEDYKWEDAREVYLALLRAEPKQPEAEEGLLRTGRMIRALLRYERLIDEAAGQATRADFQGAIRSFNEAMGIKPAYLPLDERTRTLREYLERQSRPVSVTFSSDNRTWITITGFRLLGRFNTMSVDIMPGDYEVLGRRQGFEDVRYILQVRHGMPSTPLNIVATNRSDSRR